MQKDLHSAGRGEVVNDILEELSHRKDTQKSAATE
jgi:hypothetical protein